MLFALSPVIDPAVRAKIDLDYRDAPRRNNQPGPDFPFSRSFFLSRFLPVF
jgi:hypothetical protein